MILERIFDQYIKTACLITTRIYLCFRYTMFSSWVANWDSWLLKYIGYIIIVGIFMWCISERITSFQRIGNKRQNPGHWSLDILTLQLSSQSCPTIAAWPHDHCTSLSSHIITLFIDWMHALNISHISCIGKCEHCNLQIPVNIYVYLVYQPIV